MQNDDPQVLSKLINCLKQSRPTFGFAKDFFRRGPAVRNVEVLIPCLDQKAGTASFELLREVPSKLASRMERARLHRSYGQIQESRCLHTGKTVQFAKKNHGPQALPKLRNRADYNFT